MSTNGPPPIDNQILEFKNVYKLKYYHDSSSHTYKFPTSLITASTTYGLTFVGEKSGFKIIPNGALFNENEDFDQKTLLNIYYHRNIELPSSPTYIALNCDQKLLAVTYIEKNVPILRIYIVESFFTPTALNYSDVRLSSSDGVYVADLSWNPVNSNILACCTLDGTLSVYTFNTLENFEIKSVPHESNSTCICWSPKGKQIVVGNAHGNLTQYTPELKAYRNYPSPSDLFPEGCTLCSVAWLSTFQFIGAYKSREANAEDNDVLTRVIVVNTTKTGQASFLNYDDVCFSNGIDRPVQYYFIHISAWNLIFVLSSNSVEVAVLGLNTDGITWVPWNLEPEQNRITLPISKVGEAFPIGVTLDCSSRVDTKLPLLSIATTTGLVCAYMVNYLNTEATSIGVPAVNADTQLFSRSEITDSSNESENNCSQVETNYVEPNITELSQITEINSEPEITILPPVTQQMNSNITATNVSLSANTTQSLLNVTQVETPSILGTPNEHVLPQVSSQVKNHETFQKEAPTVISANIEQETAKNIDHEKARQETIKNMKKNAATFDNDIKEIKYMISKIKVGNDGNDGRKKLMAKLEVEGKRVKDDYDLLTKEVECLKTTSFELLSLIQNSKSRCFQLMNPNFKSLVGIQEIDQVSANNQKTIINTISYVQTQIEKANKKLDDTWYKYIQRSEKQSTKVPIMENVYETLVKQRKILLYLKGQTDILQRRLSATTQRLSTISGTNSQSQKKLINVRSPPQRINESLDELTQRVLNLNASDDEIDPKTLAQKLAIEHARRFHLSHSKKMRLQELLCNHDVTYIQSSRLQRLKKKSLIIFSKNASDDAAKAAKNNVYSPVDVDAISSKTNADTISNLTSRTDNICTLSGSDDDKKLQETLHSTDLASSTPLKHSTTSRFTMESTFQTDLPVIQSNKAETTKSMSQSSQLGNPIFEKSNFESEPSSGVTKSITNSSVLTSTSTTAQLPTVTSSNSKEKSNFFSSINIKPVTTATDNSTPSFTKATLANSTTATPISTLSLVTAKTETPVTTSSVFSAINLATTLASPTNATKTTVTSTSNLFTVSSATAFSTTSNTPSSLTGSSLFKTPEPIIAQSTTTTAIATATITSPTGQTGTSLFKTTSVPTTTNLFGNFFGAGVSSTATGNSFSKNSSTATTTSSSFLPGLSSPTADTKSLFNRSPANTVCSNGVTSSSGSLFGSEATGKLGSLFGGQLTAPTTTTPSLGLPIFSTSSTTVPSSTPTSKAAGFSSFSFTNIAKPAATDSFSSVTITEISTEIGNQDADDDDKADKENIASSGNTAPTMITEFIPVSATSSNANPQNSNSLFGTTTNSMLVTNPVSSVSSSPFNTTSTNVTTNPSGSLFGNVTITPVKSDSSSSTSTVSSSISIAPGTASFTTVSPVSSSSTIGATTSLFGPKSHPVTSVNTVESATSFFGGLGLTAQNVVTTSASNAPMFGKPSQTPLFNSAASTSGESIFGSSNDANKLPMFGKSIFGSGQQMTTTTAAGAAAGNSIFGSSNTISAPPLFGNGQQMATTTTTAAAGNSMFGSQPISSNKNPSMFGQSGGALFGNASTPVTSGTSLFGGSTQNQTNIFDSSTGGSLFGTQNPNTSMGFGSGFQNQNSSSGFGAPPTFSNTSQGSGGFGAPPTFGNSAFSSFGSVPTFGGSPVMGTSPAKGFGQSSNNMTFGAASNQGSTGFEALANSSGSTFGALAQQQPTQGFGSPTTFNTSPNNGFGSIFGGSASFQGWR